MAELSSAHDGRRQYPQIDWLLATKFRHLPPGQWLPIIVEYDPKTAPSPEISLRWFAELSWLSDDLRAGVEVPPVFKDPPRVFDKKPFPFCTMLVDRGFLQRIAADPGWNRTVLRAEVGPPLNDAAARSFYR